MGSFTDFLFEGKPPQSVTTYGQTVEGTPKWMSDYTQGLIARANAAAAEPYIPYGGPRIAGFEEEQEQAFGLAKENIGAYQPYLEAGAEGYRGGLEAAGGIRERAQPYIDAATGKWTDPGVAESGGVGPGGWFIVGRPGRGSDRAQGQLGQCVGVFIVGVGVHLHPPCRLAETFDHVGRDPRNQRRGVIPFDGCQLAVQP